MVTSRVKRRSSFKDQYRSNKADYDFFILNVKRLMTQLLEEQGLAVQAIESRVKSWESARDKAMKSPSKYSSLDDMEDICGLRIILWSDDQIEEAGSLIEGEFDASPPKIKEDSLMPDRFGYRSRHYVVSLSSPRTVLPEYHKFKHLKAEIQVRSALQHVWAQIEHDLGYKGEVSLPRSIARRFARLAALLEIGDELIKDARAELDQYRQEIPRRIERDPDLVPIDRLSLRIFLCGEGTGRELDKELAQMCATTIQEGEPSKNRVMKELSALSRANLA